MAKTIDHQGGDRHSGGGGLAPWRAVLWSGVALLFVTPFVMMQLSDDWNWGPLDFVVFGTMLLGVCAAFELTASASRHAAHRVGAVLALVTAFMLVWVNLAVGVIGAEDNRANLVFAGVLAVGAAGALLARLKPAGMARAMLATALAQVAAGAVALVVGVWPEGLLACAFVAPWLVCAWLFHIAGKSS